ncbi:MAG: 4-hydroxy-tetrahydrodipicolinate reductase, partial [Clostridia bacterium]|nr:4-hydroxy-tetrahydrodipicolinate reductase [Clostridia bacterium]
EHEVMFCGQNEIVTLSHSAASREVFATGALRAARFMVGKDAGMYDMNDVVNCL